MEPTTQQDQVASPFPFFFSSSQFWLSDLGVGHVSHDMGSLTHVVCWLQGNGQAGVATCSMETRNGLKYEFMSL